MKNAMQLKAIIKNLAKEKHISVQLVMQNFMLERLLERISISKYQQNFILKGGFLIAAMVGLDTRATMDMDATIKGLWKCSKISTLWGKMGQIFALVVVRDHGNTTNGKMKNRKCG